MQKHWGRRAAALGATAALSLTGVFLSSGTAFAGPSGCNGDICIELEGDHNGIGAATITYTGDEHRRWVFGLRTANGLYWSPGVEGGDGASYTWTNSNMLFPAGQVCATMRVEGTPDGPPGYPCVTITYW